MSVRALALILIIISSALARKSGGYSRGSVHYPPSHGYSGTGSGGAHSYPVSTGLSSNKYTPHSTGLSGNQYTQKSHATTYQNHAPTSYHHTTHTSEVHHHYHYSPPQFISYGSVNHPVYHSNPPVYIYEYKNSGSRFDNLLTGLALYNLGRMSASHSHYDPHREYRSRPGEICKLGISKSNGEYEETRVNCNLMSSFIWEAEENRSIVSQTNTKLVTTVNITETVNNANNSNNTISKTVVVQNTTVADALQVKGSSVKISPGMNCFMIRISHDYSVLKRKVECGLLQAYAQNSLRYNGCIRNVPGVVIFLISIISVYIGE